MNPSMIEENIAFKNVPGLIPEANLCEARFSKAHKRRRKFTQLLPALLTLFWIGSSLPADAQHVSDVITSVDYPPEYQDSRARLTIDVSIWHPQPGGLHDETRVVWDKNEIIVIVHPKRGNFHVVGTIEETVSIEGIIPGEYDLSVILIPDLIIVESNSDPVLLTRRSIEIPPRLRTQLQRTPDGSKVFSLLWAATSNDFLLETSMSPFSASAVWDLASSEPLELSPSGLYGRSFQSLEGNHYFRLRKTADQSGEKPPLTDGP